MWWGTDNVPSALFAGVSLGQSSVDGVSQGELGQVFGGVILILVDLEGVYK